MSDSTGTSSSQADVVLVDQLEAILARSPERGVATQDVEELREPLRMWFAELGHTSPLRRNHGRGAQSSVLFGEGARWILETARRDTPESAVTLLRTFIERNEATFQEVLLFWGMHPPTPIELAEGLFLGPLDALPSSAPQSHFLAESVSEADKRTAEYVTQYLKPRAVLARGVPVKPIYQERMESPPPFTWDDKFFMAELLQIIPLVIRSPVIREAEWQQWSPDIPVLSLGTGRGCSSHARATHEIPKTSFNEGLAQRLVRRFLALSPQDRNRLRLPLRRLNEALLSQSLSDRAIEIGVALESLLSQDGDPVDGITHRVAVRAALLIGSELPARQATVKEVKTLYGLRSKAAHGVDLDEVERERIPPGLPKKYKDPQVINTVLEQGQDLVCKVAAAILKRRGFPDYQELELDPPRTLE